MNLYENQIAVKRQEEKPTKLHLSVAKTEDVKLPRRRIINYPAETQMTELYPESSSLSPTSCDSEEQTSSTDSPEPDFTMTNGFLDNFSISIRTYTDADSLSSSFDRFSYGLSQNQCYEYTSPLSSNNLGVQEFSSLVQGYTPFAQGECLDYCFFARDGSLAHFLDGPKAHDRVAELYLATGGAHSNRVIDGNGCVEAECGSSRRRDGTTPDLNTRDDGDVDFSKWLLTVEAQDGKDNLVVGQTDSLQRGPRVTIQQSESDGGPSRPRFYDVRCPVIDDGAMQRVPWNVERAIVPHPTPMTHSQ